MQDPTGTCLVLRHFYFFKVVSFRGFVDVFSPEKIGTWLVHLPKTESAASNVSFIYHVWYWRGTCCLNQNPKKNTAIINFLWGAWGRDNYFTADVFLAYILFDFARNGTSIDSSLWKVRRHGLFKKHFFMRVLETPNGLHIVIFMKFWLSKNVTTQS